MNTILGAGGAIGDELAAALIARQEAVRLVSRHPKPMPGAAEVIAADLATPEGALKAVSGCRVAYLLAGLPYDLKVWRELWPRIMRNVIEACKRANASLVFFDNVYMYGKVQGAMTEETPFRPTSRKGEVRAKIATMLLEEIRSGNLTAMIARAADFYGPRVRTGISNVLVFDKFAAGQKAMWLVNDSVKHSFTYTPDAARSLILLAENERAWNQTWHVPTAPDPPTGREFIERAAHAFGVAPKYRVASRPLLWVGGRFDKTIRESYEMLYQYEAEYLFDSTRFTSTFAFKPTSYREGIRLSVAACRP
jgi:nucleoside-diphosphate-sugar epimerase